MTMELTLDMNKKSVDDLKRRREILLKNIKRLEEKIEKIDLLIEKKQSGD